MTPENWEQLVEDLVAYADGELDAARAAEVERALATSPVLQRELDALQRSWVALDAITEGDLPPASAARLDAIEAQIRAQAGATAPAPAAKSGLLIRFPWLGPVVAAAGVLLVAGLGWSMLSNSSGEDAMAVKPNQPAPKVPRTKAPEVGIDERIPETPKQPTPGQRDEVPEAPEQPSQPEQPEPPVEQPAEPVEQPLAPVERPQQPEPTQPEPDADSTGPVIAEADFDTLSDEEQELVENLELAMLLDEGGELGELTAEELEAELFLQDVNEDLEGWDPDELEAG